MKKIIALLSILFAFTVSAADLTDTIGAECGRILFSLNEFKYPDNYEIIKKRNAQLNDLEECIKLYKDVNGTIENLNTKYFRAYTIYEMNMSVCSAEKDTKKHDSCENSALSNFNENLRLSSYELSDKYSFIYDNIDEAEQKEENLSYKLAKKSKEITQEWFDDDVEKVKNMVEELKTQNEKENNKGFFNWFK